MDLAALTEPLGAVGAECVTFQMALYLESLEPLSGAERKAGGPWLSPVSSHPAEVSAPLNSSTLEPLWSTQLLAPLGMTLLIAPSGCLLCFSARWSAPGGQGFLPSIWHTVLNKFL